MNKQELQEPVSPSPVLPRLDRLDRLLQLLEEKHSLSARYSSNPVIQKGKQEEDQCKTLSSALEEVQYKGTLMERLTMLENRVLQLSLEMDERNTSKSSTSTIPDSEKLDHADFKSSTGSGKQDENHEAVIMTLHGSQSPVAVREQDQDRESGLASAAKKTGRKNGTRQRKKGYRNWLGRFHLGCN